MQRTNLRLVRTEDWLKGVADAFTQPADAVDGVTAAATTVDRNGTWSLAANLVRLARPKDWVKNVFILLPLPFALATGGQLHVVPFLCALAGFALMASAVYTMNDLLDASADRLHPKKCLRPIAAGLVSAEAAALQAGLLAVAAVALSAFTGCGGAVVITLIYALVNVAYSFGAKHLALLDVFLLSSGFVLRVLLGCVLVGVPPSAWLLLCTSSVALFLGFAKRRADLLAEVDPSHRPSLRGYTREFLSQAVTICGTVTILAYALYCIEAKVLLPSRQMASMPFVAYGVLNYLRLIHLENEGSSPVEVAFRSRSSQICAVGWTVAILWSIGLW
jgi:4-hydroxybenzoate polyprenyltransferase